MADIEVVVKIPDNVFKRLVAGEVKYGGITARNIFNLVKKGTPLPKGHGRLGDLDALETEMVNGIHAGNYEEGYETFSHIVDMDDCVDCVRYTDTIIEADKESEDK